MYNTIEQIEDAVISTLEPLKDFLGVRTIKSYQGELDSEDDVHRIARLFPAVFIVYGGSEYAESGNRTTEIASFLLFVCDKNLRVEEESRRGGGQNPGTYAMLNAIRETLAGVHLLDGTRLPRLRRETPIWFGKGISIYSAEYEIIQHYK